MVLTTPPLIKHWAPGPKNELHDAAFDGLPERVVALLSLGSIDINQGDPQGWTPLMHAAFWGFSRVVKVLLDRGASTSMTLENGHSALHLASQCQHLAVIAALVQAGADQEAINCQGLTPLHLAAGLGHFEVVQALIEAGSTPDTCLPSDGETPLFTASGKGYVDVVRALLSANANARLPRTSFSNVEVVPLENTVCQGHVEVVHELLQHRGIEGCGGAGVGVDVLYLSIRACSPRIVRLLVDAGADTESKFGIIGNAGDVEYGGTILTLANRVLRTKKVDGKNATQEQLNGLEGIRRLLMRVEAVHAVSWLWHTERAVIARAFYVSSKSTMMPTLRRRASRPGVFLGPVFR